MIVRGILLLSFRSRSTNGLKDCSTDSLDSNAYMMFTLHGDTAIMTGSHMPSTELIDARRDRVAVAVKAIMLTLVGIKLRTSPILNKVSRKVSPLYSTVCA